MKTINEILDFAINEEEKASKFYRKLADKMKRNWMQDVFLDFSKEELRHKAILIDIKNKGMIKTVSEKVLNLKIIDNINKEVAITDDLDYIDALLVAMKAEKEAFILYSKLAEEAEDEDTKNLLSTLANEEAKHKLKFEIEYDDLVLQDN